MRWLHWEIDGFARWQQASRCAFHSVHNHTDDDGNDSTTHTTADQREIGGLEVHSLLLNMVLHQTPGIIKGSDGSWSAGEQFWPVLCRAFHYALISAHIVFIVRCARSRHHWCTLPMHGLPKEQILVVLSKVLPNTVDQLTPEGRLPTRQEI